MVRYDCQGVSIPLILPNIWAHCSTARKSPWKPSLPWLISHFSATKFGPNFDDFCYNLSPFIFHLMSGFDQNYAVISGNTCSSLHMPIFRLVNGAVLLIAALWANNWCHSANNWVPSEGGEKRSYLRSYLAKFKNSFAV